jgi:alpha-L-arabinofuranosidase
MAGDLRNLMARPLFYERFYRDVQALIRREVPGRDVRLAINEWGLDLPESLQYSMAAAVYAARLMNVFERSSPLVAMSAVSDLVNGWPGGIIQASRHGVFVTPIYHVNRMYAERLGSQRLRARVESPTFDSSREGRRVPALDAVASRSTDGREIYLKLVNTDLERDLDTRVDLRGAQVEPRAELVLLTAPDLQTRQGFASPDAITPRTGTIAAGNDFRLSIPRHSVAVLRLTVQGGGGR